MPKPRINLKINEGPVHIPRAARPHIAQEYVELHGFNSDRVLETIIKLSPRVRCQALGLERGSLPPQWMHQHISRQKGGTDGRSEPDTRAAA